MFFCLTFGVHITLILIKVSLKNSPLGRYSCIAQGASPGLFVIAYLLSPKGAAQSQHKANTCSVSAAPEGALNFCVPCLPRVSFRALPKVLNKRSKNNACLT